MRVEFFDSDEKLVFSKTPHSVKLIVAGWRCPICRNKGTENPKAGYEMSCKKCVVTWEQYSQYLKVEYLE